MEKTEAGQAGYVYWLYGAGKELLYVGVTRDFGARYTKHLHSKPWADEIRDTASRKYLTYKQAEQAESEAIATQHPLYNIAGVQPARLHARQLANLLRKRQVPRDPGMTNALRDLAEVLASHLKSCTGESLPAPGVQGVLPGMPSSLNGDEPGYRLHPARQRMYELLIERGAMGYQVGMLQTMLGNKGLGVARQTVHDWLAQDEKSGYVYRIGKPKSGRSRWIWRLRAGDELDIPGWH